MADGGERSSKKPRGDKAKREEEIARENWARYEYGKLRGHEAYCRAAVKLEQFYLGSGASEEGGQWNDDDRQELEDGGRRTVEFNEIADAINTALGNQIQNRVDMAYRPRGGDADADKATKLSKVAMQICDNNDYGHVETDVAQDGYIQQRGYFDMRVRYDDTLKGEVYITNLDPLDVLPDPDAKAYDPDTWKDVIITRWLSLDDIEAMYGAKARAKVEKNIEREGDEDFGESELDGVRRPKFGMDDDTGSGFEGGEGWERCAMVRVIDRQHWKMAETQVALYPEGDIRIIEDITDDKLQGILNAGAMTFRKPMMRVRWTISTYGNVVLHDGWSPYRHFTIIPFFPFFRRGQTRGLVDNAIGPQEMLNKALSQYLHIINTTANSGWIVEQHSLTNMETDDLEDTGAQTGLIVEYKKGSTPPEKIQPNTVPTGIDKLVQLGSTKIRTVTGISDALRGQGMANQSGKAIQSLQFGSQLSLAVPLDNLARTRHMLAKRLLKLIQGFMDMPQLLRIVERNAAGVEQTVELPINMEQDDGTILNDLTIGEYDVVVTEQPSQVTFENGQYEQAMQMRKDGIPIPDHVVLRYSSLADKQEVAAEMKEQAGRTDPEKEAKAMLAQAQAKLAQATAVTKGVEALFSAMRASGLLRTDPGLAAIADMLAKSAGFVDQDGGSIFPMNVQPGPAAVPTNTNPLTPDNPDAGLNTGIESGIAETA